MSPGSAQANHRIRAPTGHPATAAKTTSDDYRASRGHRWAAVDRRRKGTTESSSGIGERFLAVLP
ncbi:MAG TPA: hypothetical protein DIT03_01955 [Candidatus Accumulibacter sp.]|nr:hypothetical protein [Accumulibacter sp.]HCN67040.1 hypothetical protein [Accumulibacter sp.]